MGATSKVRERLDQRVSRTERQERVLEQHVRKLYEALDQLAKSTLQELQRMTLELRALETRLDWLEKPLWKRALLRLTGSAPDRTEVADDDTGDVDARVLPDAPQAQAPEPEGEQAVAPEPAPQPEAPAPAPEEVKA